METPKIEYISNIKNASLWGSEVTQWKFKTSEMKEPRNEEAKAFKSSHPLAYTMVITSAHYSTDTKPFNESCYVTEQCVTARAECRSDGLGNTKCLCEDGVEIYDPDSDTCLACNYNFYRLYTLKFVSDFSG